MFLECSEGEINILCVYTHQESLFELEIEIDPANVALTVRQYSF